MDTLHHEMSRLLDEHAPTLLARWETIVAEEEREVPGEDCAEHPGCRSVLDGPMPGRG